MNQQFYTISPTLEEQDAYIEDWEFKYWPNQPNGEVIQNPNGTFSIRMEENFTPLVEQLQNLFKNENMPENGTYLGEAVAKGSMKPKALIGGDFLNASGLFLSQDLLNIFTKFNLPFHKYYKIPLIYRKKNIESYGYINFSKDAKSEEQDIKFIKVKDYTKICVSKRLKDEIENSGIVGCVFKLVE
jgi:hypothetical protein